MSFRLPASLLRHVLSLTLTSSVGVGCKTANQAEEKPPAPTACDRYCGAVFGDALLGDELPPPLRGAGEAVMAGWEPLGYVHALENERHVILLDQALEGQRPRFEIVDVLELGRLDVAAHVAYGNCSVNGVMDTRVVAVGTAGSCEDAPDIIATRAWRVDTTTRRFLPADAQGVTCARDDCFEPGGVPMGVIGGAL